MSNVYEIGLYINRYSQVEAQRVVFPLLVKKDTYADYIPMVKRMDELPPKLIVVGGERSIRTVTKEMYRRGQLRPLGILGGGSTNVLYEYLRSTGREMTLQQFREIPPDKFDPKFYFRPGIAKDEKGEIEEFNIQMGNGMYEIFSGLSNELLRFIPPQFRPFSSRTLAYVPAIIRKGNTLDLYSLSPNIGRVRAFPEQDLFGSDITHARIEGSRIDQARKLTTTLVLWQFHQRPPKEILRIDKGVIFEDHIHSDSAWFDGDVEKHRLKLHGTVIISRVEAKLTIPVMAIRK